MRPKPFEDCRGFILKRNRIDGPVEVDDLDLLQSLDYDTNTPFKHKGVPMQVLEDAKVPPMGIDELHKQGLTGKGVNVAIIDQPILPHAEYAEQIAAYKTFDAGHISEFYNKFSSSYHGPAVASLLVGKNIGVAPDAKLYFAGDTSSRVGEKLQADAKVFANALLWIIEENKKLSEKDKIKFVSVSATPESKLFINGKSWEKAVELAEQNGIVVVQCGKKGFVNAGYIDRKTHDFVKRWPDWSPLKRKTSVLKEKLLREKKVSVPTSYRTIATKETHDGKTEDGYTYCGKGGLSWGIPYAVGLLAIGQQIAPDLTAKQLKDIFIASATKDMVVDPQNFVKMVREKSKAPDSVKYPKGEKDKTENSAVKGKTDRQRDKAKMATSLTEQTKIPTTNAKTTEKTK